MNIDSQLKKNHMHLGPNSGKTNIEVGRSVFHSIKPSTHDATYKLTLYHTNRTDDDEGMPKSE